MATTNKAASNQTAGKDAAPEVLLVATEPVAHDPDEGYRPHSATAINNINGCGVSVSADVVTTY